MVHIPTELIGVFFCNIYCGDGFQGWRKLGPAPLFLFHLITRERRSIDFDGIEFDFASIDRNNKIFESFEWYPIVERPEYNNYDYCNVTVKLIQI